MEKKYSGMTVNERLFVSGLLEEFDIAVKENDYSKSVLILRKVELNDESIEQILKSLGLNPPFQDD